ncbi:hypothetical protein BX265_2310 [Streptomyces sp. TLI_235]|nr:hypothetical protein BX265_2310 [Streptomyces sp. TLI_235]
MCAVIAAAPAEWKQADPAGAEQGEWVEVARAPQQAPVQAVPARAVVTAVGNRADDVSGGDRGASPDGALDRQVGGPQRRVSRRGVGHRHHRTPGHRSGERDDAGSCGAHRSAHGGGHVDTPVPGRPARGGRFEAPHQAARPPDRPGPAGTLHRLAARPDRQALPFLGGACIGDPDDPGSAERAGLPRVGSGTRRREHQRDRAGQHQGEQQPAPTVRRGRQRKQRTRPGTPRRSGPSGRRPDPRRSPRNRPGRTEEPEQTGGPEQPGGEGQPGQPVRRSDRTAHAGKARRRPPTRCSPHRPLWTTPPCGQPVSPARVNNSVAPGER